MGKELLDSARRALEKGAKVNAKESTLGYSALAFAASGGHVDVVMLGRGVGSLVEDLRFVHDGWYLIAQINTADVIQQSFMWGLDGCFGRARRSARAAAGSLSAQVVQLSSIPSTCPTAGSENPP